MNFHQIIRWAKTHPLPICLSLGTLLIAFVYLFRLTDYPVNFSRDEASVAYNAYSILKTGRDEWGVYLPLHFKGPGDYPPGFAFYITVPFVALFGLNEWSARLPAAIFGSLNLIATYFLIKKITGKSTLALFTGLFTVIAPLHFINARTGSEVIYAYFFSLLTLLFFLSKRWYLTILVATLALLSYLSTRIYLPLSVICTYICLVRDRQRSHLLIIMSLILLSFIFTITGDSQIRFQSVSIFAPPKETLNVFSTQDGLTSLNLVATRIIHNQYTYMVKSFIFNFIDYLNFNYLFTNGGFPTRFKVSETGILLLFELPFFIVGFVALFARKRQLWWYFIGMSLISILPAAITNEYSPNVRRGFALLLPLCFFVAYGLIATYRECMKLTFPKKWLKIIFIFGFTVLLTLNLIHFTDQLVVHNQFVYALSRSQDYHFFINSLNQTEGNFDHIYWTSFADNPYIFYAFYNQIDPHLIQATASIRPSNFANQTWSLGKITFVTDDCPYQLTPNSLYIGKGEFCINKSNAAPHIQLIKSFSSPGTPIYDFYTDIPQFLQIE